MQKAAIKLQKIQSELVAPKNLFNKFGGYAYRSAESILEAVKPLLQANEAILTISDEMVDVGGRVYVKATASFTTDGETIKTTAFAREPDDRKGMDASQITGASSSYARKYALNGLFCIDDTKDADATNDHGKSAQKDNDDMVDRIITSFHMQKTMEDLDAKLDKAKAAGYGANPAVIKAYDEAAYKLNQ